MQHNLSYELFAGAAMLSLTDPNRCPRKGFSVRELRRLFIQSKGMVPRVEGIFETNKLQTFPI